MSKWGPRLIGVLVLLLLVLVALGFLLKPDVPEVLQREIDLQVRGQTLPPPAQTQAPTPEETPPANTQLTPPALTLTSLEDFPADGGAAPVLANPHPDNREQTAAVVVPPPVVEKPALPEKPAAADKPPARTPAPAADGKWIAAGAFGNPDNTKRRVEQLRNRGWPVKVEKIQSGGKTLDRVVLGPVPPAQVNVYLDELNKMGIQGREIQ